jgi:hypothetical protein
MLADYLHFSIAQVLRRATSVGRGKQPDSHACIYVARFGHAAYALAVIRESVHKAWRSAM